MGLSSDLISQFVKVTNDATKSETTDVRYGTIVEYNGSNYVKLDGSDLLTPISTTTDAEPGERVTVLIENHTATVTGNMSSPAARTTTVKELGSQISEFEIIVADKVSTQELEAESARIDELVSDNVTIKEKLTASEAEIADLQADNVTINEKLTANEASIENLEATKLDAEIADITYATIDDLDATNAYIYNLEATYGDFQVLTTEKFEAVDASISDLKADKLSATDAELTYANIDFSNIGEAAIETFYAKSGVIQDVVISDGQVTGTLVGVTIKGDLIEGGTIVADKLVIKGDDGLYYKLNTDGETVSSEQTEYNSLSGTIITAKSVTAEKIAVDDLVAFDATIGGFNITDSSIYSGVKESVSNTTRGIYLDKNGQVAFGDASNYLKYFKDTDGTWKLAISAGSMVLSSSGKTVEETISDIQVGGRNLLLNSSFSEDSTNWIMGSSNTDFEITEVDGVACGHITGASGTSEYIKYTRQNVTEKINGDNLDQVYTFSADVRLDNYADGTGSATPYFVARLTGSYVNSSGGTSSFSASTVSGSRDIAQYAEQGWVRMVWVVKFNHKPASMYCDMYSQNVTGDLYFKNLKLELGNMPTDWTPAPEDVDEDIEDAQTSANNAQATADDAQSRITIAESTIQQLSDCISTLVTDENGTSLMVQTGSGWTFSTSELQQSIDDARQSLSDLAKDLGDADAVISVLQQTINDHGTTLDYINLGAYEDEPCIELGESDSDFKLLITNTRIMFMFGSTRKTYIDSDGLTSDNVTVENELRQGGFIWKTRANGNLGLIWKEDS